MYHVLSESENGNLGIKVEGKLTQGDYELLIPYIDRLRQEVGLVGLLCDMTDCEGLNSQVLWEDLAKQFQQFHEIIRIAVVGDRQWMECGTKVFYPLKETKVQYFTPEQMEKSWKWLKEDGT